LSETIQMSPEEWRKKERRAARDLRHAHARGLMQGVLSMLRPGDLVIDCGANVGEVSQPLAETGASVHAFEPDPYAFEKLTERLARFDNVTLHHAAVGVTSGRIRLMRAANFDDNPKGASVKSTIVEGGRGIDETGAEAMDVALVDLPAFIGQLVEAQGRIAFLKMDIEGAELELLETMLARKMFDHIGLTVAETHERKFKALRPRFKALRKAVAARYPITQVNLDWI
jgi:FkbM family methyltransferase